MILDTCEPYRRTIFQPLLIILHQILAGSVIFEPSKIRTNIAIMIRNFEQCLGFFRQLTSDWASYTSTRQEGKGLSASQLSG